MVKPKGGQDLCAPSLPRLQWQLLHVAFCPLEELFQRTRRHVFRYKYYL